MLSVNFGGRKSAARRASHFRGGFYSADFPKTWDSCACAESFLSGTYLPEKIGSSETAWSGIATLHQVKRLEATLWRQFLSFAFLMDWFWSCYVRISGIQLPGLHNCLTVDVRWKPFFHRQLRIVTTATLAKWEGIILLGGFISVVVWKLATGEISLDYLLYGDAKNAIKEQGARPSSVLVARRC